MTITKPTLTKLRTDKRSDSNSDVWTVFLNTDADLREAVLDIPAPTTFKTGWRNEEWTIEAYEDNEVKCIQGKNVKYFTKEEIEEIQKDTIKKIRISQFNPFQNFFKQFGSLYRYQSYTEPNYATQSVKVITGGDSPSEESEKTGSIFSHLGMCHENEYEFSDRTTDIKLQFKHHSSTGFMEYTDEGDFINRDYNYALQLYEQKKPDFLRMYEDFRKSILDLGPLVKSVKSNILYGEKFCYVPYTNDDDWGIEFTLEKVPLRYGMKESYQRYSGDDIHKKPKNVISLTPDEVLSFIETKFTEQLMEKFTNA